MLCLTWVIRVNFSVLHRTKGTKSFFSVVSMVRCQWQRWWWWWVQLGNMTQVLTHFELFSYFIGLLSNVFGNCGSPSRRWDATMCRRTILSTELFQVGARGRCHHGAICYRPLASRQTFFKSFRLKYLMICKDNNKKIIPFKNFQTYLFISSFNCDEIRSSSEAAFCCESGIYDSETKRIDLWK